MYDFSDIKKSYDKGNLIPFIGAGFSKIIKGYPTWEQFITQLECTIAEKKGFFFKNFGNDMLEATEYFVMRKAEEAQKRKSPGEAFKDAKHRLRDLIRDTFKNIRYRKNEWILHSKLVSAKRLNQIFTTNWDNTLETACKKNNIEYHSIIFDHGFKEYIEKKSKLQRDGKSDVKILQIIKYHGDSEESDSIIACETDFYRRMTNLNSLDIKFKNELLYHDFLFIGYSFRDINVKYTLDQMNVIIKQISPDFRPKIYFVSKDKSSNARMELLNKQRGIKVLYLFSLLADDIEISYPHIIDNKDYKLIFTRGMKSFSVKPDNDKIYINEIVKFDEIKDNINESGLNSKINIGKLEEAYEKFTTYVMKCGYNKLFDELFKGD